MSVLRARGPQCENEADLEVDGLDLISSLEQDDPRLIRIIQNWFLERVPDPGVPYKFSVDPPVIEGQIGVPGIVDTLLNKKQNGFYIGEGSGHWERLAMWCTRLLQDLEGPGSMPVLKSFFMGTLFGLLCSEHSFKKEDEEERS